MAPKRLNDSVHWYIDELAARIVAKSGIPSDRHHLGKMILNSLKEDPNFVIQIDGSTGESDTNESVLQRSIKCAVGLRKLGLEKGDVIVLMAPNHLDVSMPFYAALYLGLPIAAVDRAGAVLELKGTFSTCKPKVIFCQSERASDVQLALKETELKAHIVTFDKGDCESALSFAEFLECYEDNTDIDEFRPADFDPAETIAFLVATSGTTGLPKVAALTHLNFAMIFPYTWKHYTKFPTPIRMCLVVSQLQWVTAITNYVSSALLRFTRLQTSAPPTQDHLYDLINKYRPTYMILSPTLMKTLVKLEDRERCDFTCFETILLSGSAVSQDLIEEIKKVTPQTDVFNVYGMSELSGIAFDFDSPPPGSCGKPMGCYQQCRLVKIDTQEDITEPNVPGELWLKGPGVFKGYYDNAEATENAFAEDRWFKTGDMFYRDANWNFFFVDRIKLLLKYKNYQISPAQIEEVIRQHPGVLDAVVTGIPDPECGDLPVACVVPKNGCNVSAQEIKDLVKETLSDTQQLRGGVIFLKELPFTATTKVHRRQLNEIALRIPRE